MNITNELTKLPDVNYLTMLNPPWELALKEKGALSWGAVQSLLDTQYGSDLPFRLFAEWAICILSLSMIEAGEQVTPNGVIEHIKTQGHNLVTGTSLSADTRTMLDVLVNHPKEHFGIMMAEAVWRLSGSIQPIKSAELGESPGKAVDGEP